MFRFLLFLAVLCLGYYYLVGPKDEPVTERGPSHNSSVEVSEKPDLNEEITDSIRQLEYEESLRAAQEEKGSIGNTLRIFMLIAAAFVVVVIFTSTKIARTIFQGKSRVKARNAMLNHIKDSNEKVTGHGRANDDLGKTEWVTTRDATGSEKNYYIFDMDDADKYPEK